MVSSMLALSETDAAPRRSRGRAGFDVLRAVELVAFLVGIVAAVALSLTTLGLPASLVLLGTWLLAAACHRVVPGLQGTVSWAAGVLLEVGLLAVLSGLMAKLSPHEQGTNANLALLAAPVVVAVAALAMGLVLDRRATKEEDAPRRESARPGIALTVIVAGLALAAHLGSQGHLYGVAWAMSGDARNHVVVMRSVLLSGGITINQLRSFPVAIDAMAAALSGGGGRSGLAPGHLFVHDAWALVDTYILAGLGIATVTISALLECLPRTTTALRRLSPATYIALLASSALSTTGLVLGTATRDGYVSAYATIPLTLAAMTLGLACVRRATPAAYALLGPAIVLTFFSWTILAVAPAAIVVTITALLAVRARGALASGGNRNPGLLWIGSLVVTLGCLVATAGVWLTHLTLLKTTFKLTGAITAPNVHLLYVLGFVAAGAVFGARTSLDRRQMLVPFSAALAGGLSLVWLMGLSPDHKSWTYYGIKQLWLVSSCLVWLLFLPIVQASTSTSTIGPRLAFQRVSRMLQAVAWSLAALVAVGLTTPLPGPVTLAGQGWNQPSAQVLADIEVAADQGRPVVMWGWSDPGNERLANFWSSLAWGYTSTDAIKAFAPALPGGIVYWAYVEQGTPTDLCDAARSVRDLVIVTHTKDLAKKLKKVCPTSLATVVLSPTARP
ncbi:hypothetical protein acdb102_09720 [Acidothermaceae bacterium B102]|nr:hypothetical protein acdb102_09720 [Acidothermaceae bacterium B102]